MKRLTHNDLIAYLDGVADSSIVALVESDPEYQAEVNALATAERQFWSPLAQITLPDELTLGEYVLGVLSQEKMAQVENQVQLFPHLAVKIEQMEVHLRDMKMVQKTDRKDSAFLSSAQIWLAERVADLNVGLKAANSHKFQQGSFETNGVQISLNTSHDLNQRGRIRLSGMVSGEIGEEVSVQIYAQQRELIGEATLNEFDAFIFDGLESGRYTLIITCQNPPLELHIPPIEI